MTLDFTCQKCEGGFELDAQDLVDGTEKLECPHCETRATSAQVEDFLAALHELQAQVAALGKKFAVSLTIEAEEVDEDEEDDEDEDEDEDLDEDEDDEDDDEEEDLDEEDDEP